MSDSLALDNRPEVSSQTLDAVVREVSVALNEARVSLEAHVEQPGNPQLLQRCESELRQVQGVLRVMEIHGAALLAEEMCQVARYLQHPGTERKNEAEALDALMRAMVQLPSYLDRVIAGGRDLALVLLPLLNDMRAVRGSALLSEGTLLLLNLKSDRPASPVPPAAGEETVGVPQWARRVRARYQVGLIGWIRGERVEQNLDILAAVALRLEQIATSQPLFQLWWVIGAVIEALREHGLESSVSIKRLLGLGDREIKRLYEEGEARYAQTPPVELLNNLLYYVARASSNGAKVSAVRSSFRLGELLPVDESIELERENLSAPSVKLMQTVAAAIREDLAKIKDVLDIFVRRGGASPEELAPQVDLLRKIGDTLGVLGLGEQRARVQSEIARLESLVASQERPPDSVLVDIAATLIRVEDHLDDELVGMILPRPAESVSPPVDVDFQQVQAAVLRECNVNLARVKEYVSQCVGGTLDTSGFDNWPELMRGIQAGLTMLGKHRAVESIDRITTHLRALLQPRTHFAQESLDRLADAIVSVEYYMETLQAGRADPWYMLDNAEAALAAVEQASAETPAVAATVLPEGYERTQLINPPVAAPEADARSATGTHPSSLAPARAQSVVAAVDPELVTLYIEESREELSRIERQFPVWDQNPLEEEALNSVRRAFHTLKGSGRMVGARDIAEFCWAAENLLNRLIDKSITRSPAILATLRDGVRFLPQMVTQLADGTSPTGDIAGFIAQAHALASGKPLEAGATATVRTLGLADTHGFEPVRPTIAPAEREAQASAPQAPAAASPALPESSFAAPDFDFNSVFGPAAMPDTAAGSEQPAAAVPVVPPAAVVPDAAPVATAPVVEADATLRDIFARETDSHVAVVRSYLVKQAGLNAPHALPEAVYRACHTLAGSSKMAEARHGIRLAQPLDHWLRKSFDSGVGLTDSDLVLLADCMLAMEAVSRNLDETTGFFIAHDTLLRRIAQSESDLDQRIAASQGGPEPPSLMPSAATTPVAQQHPEPIVAPTASVPAATAVPAEPPVVEVDYDPEIASIFGDEATELLEEAQTALANMSPGAAHADQLLALKRPLHTLKGGARMAGVTAMGDLAHELESLITRVEVGVVRWDGQAHALLQTTLDELGHMRDLLAEGKGIPRASALNARLQGHKYDDVAPAESAASGPVAAPEPVEAPPAPQALMQESPSQAPALPLAQEPPAQRTDDLPAGPNPVSPTSSVSLDSAAGEVPVSMPPEAQVSPALELAPARHDAGSAPDGQGATPGVESDDFAQPWPADPINTEALPWTPAQPSPVQELMPAAEVSPAAVPAALLTQEPAAETPLESVDRPWPADRIEFPASVAVLQPEATMPEAEDAEAPTRVVPLLNVPEPALTSGVEPLPPPYEPALPPLDEGEAPTRLVPALELPEAPALSPAESQASAATVAAEGAAIPEQADGSARPSLVPEPERRSDVQPLAAERSPALAATVGAPALAQALVPPGREPTQGADRPELARVDAELLNQLLNHAGEVSIARSRVEQQLGSIDFNLGELSRTVTRLKDQLRKLEIETETQILHRHEAEPDHRTEFDPLELDRYSSIQQFSRALAETANDVASIQQLLETLTHDTQTLLQQQGRTLTELQNGLMRTRMVSFQRHVQRLARIVRQAAADTGKQVELVVEGASGELDRQVLERMLPPLEHILRNAVAHGIESPAQRVSAGKPETGRIELTVRREGAEVVLTISDDGAGLNLPAIRAKGLALGLIQPGQQLGDESVMQLILEPGFSTADKVTQAAGRGVGMDIVASEVKKLGGALNMESQPGRGARFTVHLPFTLAVSHALVVRVGDEHYALPLPTVEGVVRLSRSEIAEHLAGGGANYLHGGQRYRMQYLATFVGLPPSPLPENDVTLPVVLVKAGDNSTGLVADELIGSREIVVKNVGPQIASIRGVSGATILGDGRIVIILDIGALIRSEWRGRPAAAVPREKTDRRVVALVVDDSITVRRVTQRLLERNGMRVLTARDGMDAVSVLQEHTPDVILLDIEMPRMDGYEVAAHVRGDPRLKEIPIIMITSRVGEKHRARALELGVDDYLGKPYQESQLLDAIAPLVAHRLGSAGQE